MWRKACHANNTCIEIKKDGESVLIRDSKNKHHQHIKVTKKVLKHIKDR